MDTNNHKGHRKRMREDFEKGGFKTWQKHKVLEYLLYNVIPVADTNDIAHNLIKECGGFVNVFHTSKKRLMSIDGVGEKTADYICSLGEFIQYYNTEKYNTDVFVLNSETSENYLCNLFDGKSRECCYMICLDPKNRIINQEMLFEGSFESVELDVAKVLRSAVKYSGSSSYNSNGLAMYFPYDYPDYYAEIKTETDKFGYNGYNSFFDRFLSIMGTGQMNYSSENDYSDYSWYDNTNYDTYNVSDKLEVKDKGDYFALSLSDQEWDKINGINVF